MANTCNVVFYMSFKTPKARDAFVAEYKDIINTANNMNEGIAISKNERYLFNARILPTSVKSVYLSGWTKWCLRGDEVSVFLRKQLIPRGIKIFDCNYEELGCQIYGKFIFDGQCLYDTYLPITHPLLDVGVSFDSDGYYDKLDEAFELDSKKKLILRIN